MTIPSHNFGAVLFLSELGLQIHLFQRSVRRLERAAVHWKQMEDGIDDGDTAPPLEIVADCTVCLSSLAAVRRVLRPNSSAPAKAKRRATAIDDLLGQPPLTNVTAVSVRNSWEHLDDRLDDWLGTRTPGTGSITEIHVSCHPPSPSTTVLRRFDPVHFAIHFGGAVVSLSSCIVEMNDLQSRIDQAYVRLRTEKVDV